MPKKIWVRQTLLGVVASIVVILLIFLPSYVNRSGQAAGTSTSTIVGQGAAAIEAAPSLDRAFVLNDADGTISMIDLHHASTAQTLRIGGAPYPVRIGLVIDQRAGHVFVVNGGNAVRMLDARSGRLLHTVILPLAPAFLSVDERTSRVFVSEVNTKKGANVDVLDARTGLPVRRVAVGHGAGALAVDERVGHVFVQNVGENTVSMLDARSGVELRTIALGSGPSILAQAHAIGGPLPTAVRVDEQTSRAFVTRFGGVSVLDTRSGALVRTTPAGRIPSDIAVDVRTNRVFVTNLEEGTMSMLDARTGRTLNTIHVGLRPWAVAVVASVGRVCVANAGDDSVSILDAGSGRVVRTVPVGVRPTAIAVDARTSRVYVVNMVAYRPTESSWERLGNSLSRLQSALSFLSRPSLGTGSIPGSVSIVSVTR